MGKPVAMKNKPNYFLPLLFIVSLIFIQSCKDKANELKQKSYEGNLKITQIDQLQEFYGEGYNIINGCLEINFSDIAQFNTH